MEKQQHTIECGGCGEIKPEFLTNEEVIALQGTIKPIYRQCGRCGKTTGWIISALAPKGQERMATQAERDRVKSMVDENVRRFPIS